MKTLAYITTGIFVFGTNWGWSCRSRSGIVHLPLAFLLHDAPTLIHTGGVRLIFIFFKARKGDYVMRKVTGFLVGYLCLTLVILFSPADAHCQSCQQPPPHCGAAIMQSAPRTLMSPTPGLCGTYMAMPTMCPSTNQNQNIHLDVCVDGLNKAISCPASQVTPDTNVAVADDMSGEVVEFVNDAYLVLDKSGHLLAGPFSDGSLFPSQGNGGQGCYIGGNDVTVQWDKFNRRWLLAFKANTSPPMQLKRLICVAVSTTPDAAGSYYTYEYDMTPTGLATDYPQWGIWPTGYFQTLN